MNVYVNIWPNLLMAQLHGIDSILFRGVVKDNHISSDRTPVDQFSCLTMQSVGYLEVKPYRTGAGKDDVIALAGEGLDFFNIITKVGKFGIIRIERGEVNLNCLL